MSIMKGDRWVAESQDASVFNFSRCQRKLNSR